MNERIRELVGQAKFMAEETINKQISKNAELDAFAEKFAELLIRECVNTLEFHGFDEAVPYIKWMATNKLGQRFGVGE